MNQQETEIVTPPNFGNFQVTPNSKRESFSLWTSQHIDHWEIKEKPVFSERFSYRKLRLHNKNVIEWRDCVQLNSILNLFHMLENVESLSDWIEITEFFHWLSHQNLKKFEVEDSRFEFGVHFPSSFYQKKNVVGVTASSTVRELREINSTKNGKNNRHLVGWFGG